MGTFEEDLPPDTAYIVITGRALSKLVQDPNWGPYQEALENAAKFREAEVMAPCTSLDMALRAEHLKGQIAGLRLALALPTTIIDEMRRLLALEEDQADE